VGLESDNMKIKFHFDSCCILQLTWQLRSKQPHKNTDNK